MTLNIDKEVALLQQNDKRLEEITSILARNQELHMERSAEHEKNDQQRHLEIIKVTTDLREVVLVKMSAIEKYVDVKIKEQQLWIEENYSKKIEHQNLQKEVTKMDVSLWQRIGKIESIFGRAWKLVFGFIILGILAVLFDKW